MTKDEEEYIRQSERERIAIWFENGGHDSEYLYQCTNASAARHMSEFVPQAVRNNEHSQTYREYRQSIEPTWPEEYMKKVEDYEFDVDAKPWDRY